MKKSYFLYFPLNIILTPPIFSQNLLINSDFETVLNETGFVVAAAHTYMPLAIGNPPNLKILRQ
jgi:hypothetical protein